MVLQTMLNLPAVLWCGVVMQYYPILWRLDTAFEMCDLKVHLHIQEPKLSGLIWKWGACKVL